MDAFKRVIWGCTGLPGSISNSTIFSATKKHADILNNGLKTAFETGGKEILFMILGDGGFKHTNWLQKPYSCAVKTPMQRYFNYRLSQARMTTEAVFGLIKSRFRFYTSSMTVESLKSTQQHLLQ